MHSFSLFYLIFFLVVDFNKNFLLVPQKKKKSFLVVLVIEKVEKDVLVVEGV
jgi:hypothetical protein